MNVIAALQEWEMYERQIKKLRERQAKFAEIVKRETLTAKHDYQVGELVVAKWSAGRGQHDWHAIAEELDQVAVINAASQFAKVTTDWHGLCKHIGFPDDIKNRYYTPGKPSVRIKLLDGDDS